MKDKELNLFGIFTLLAFSERSYNIMMFTQNIIENSGYYKSKVF